MDKLVLIDGINSLYCHTIKMYESKVQTFR